MKKALAVILISLIVVLSINQIKGMELDFKEYTTPYKLYDFDFGELYGCAVGETYGMTLIEVDGDVYYFTENSPIPYTKSWFDDRVYDLNYVHIDELNILAVGEHNGWINLVIESSEVNRGKYVYNFGFNDDRWILDMGVISGSVLVKNGTMRVINITDNGVVYRTSIKEKLQGVSDIPTTSTAISSNKLNAIDELIDHTLYIVGDMGVVFRSGDAGENWQQVNIESDENLNDIFFSSNSEGWIISEEGTLFHTKDGASHVFFINSDDGFITVDKKGIYYTSDGGYHWVGIYQSATEIYNKIEVNTNNDIWLLVNNQTLKYNQNFFDIQLANSYYKDVYETNPEKIEIEALTEREIFQGNDGFFYPSLELSRAEAITILSRMLDTKEISNVSFSDVMSKDWFFTYVQKLLPLGILTGYEDGTFRPQNSITFEEFCVILERMDVYYQHESESISDGILAIDYPFYGEISNWSKEAMTYCYEKNYLRGLEIENIEPTKKIKRREVAALLYSYMN